MSDRETALIQTISDLQYIRNHMGNIDVLLEKRRDELEKERQRLYKH